ncbi:MAG: hypothetical protein O2923_08500 [Verrucomicrobia bacterium]|nr:hypothetical protein [Verrucomicrobiota bacterium]MDA1087017.1 hypothetical protein [Verrucomicrobiota bacterium]
MSTWDNEKLANLEAQLWDSADELRANSKLTGITRKTAMRDLSELVDCGAFALAGAKRGAHYVLAGKRKREWSYGG